MRKLYYREICRNNMLYEMQYVLWLVNQIGRAGFVFQYEVEFRSIEGPAKKAIISIIKSKQKQTVNEGTEKRNSRLNRKRKKR